MKSNLVASLTIAFTMMAFTASAHFGTVTVSIRDTCDLGEGTWQQFITQCQNQCEDLDGIRSIEITDPDSKTICYTWPNKGCGPGGAPHTWYSNGGCEKMDPQYSMMCERCL